MKNRERVIHNLREAGTTADALSGAFAFVAATMGARDVIMKNGSPRETPRDFLAATIVTFAVARGAKALANRIEGKSKAH